MGGVLITGGAKRLGAEITRKFHAEGFRVHIHCQSSTTSAQALTDSLNTLRPASAFVYQADLQHLEDIQRLCRAVVQKDPGLSVVINNASTFFPTTLSSATNDDWNRLIDVNTKAPFFILQALAETLKNNQGSVVNMVDIHGIRPLKNHPIYAIAKAGLIALTRSMALEMAPEVRVNAVAPGAILWPEVASANDADSILQKVPLKSLGTVEAIADAVWFLSQARYTTGQILPVDGGRTLNQ